MNIQVMRRAIREGLDSGDVRAVRAGEMTRIAITEIALSTMLLRIASKPQLSEISNAEMLAIALDAIADAEEVTGRSLGTYLPRYLVVARQLVAAARHG